MSSSSLLRPTTAALRHLALSASSATATATSAVTAATATVMSAVNVSLGVSALSSITAHASTSALLSAATTLMPADSMSSTNSSNISISNSSLGISTAAPAVSSSSAVQSSLLRGSPVLLRVVRYLNSDPTKTLAVTTAPPNTTNNKAANANGRHQQQEAFDSDAAVASRLAAFNSYSAQPTAAPLARRDRKKARSRDVDHPFNAYNLTIAIVGRPNVGKSTLFNKLAGRPLAIADGSAGVTRDWHDAPASLAGLEFRAVDTAGLAEVDASLERGDASRRKGGFSIHNTPFGVPIRPERRSGRGVAPSWSSNNTGASGSSSGSNGSVVVKNREARDMSSNYVLGRPLTVQLQREILELTEKAVAEADVVMFVVDARAGLNPYDIHFAQWLRRRVTPSSQSDADAVDDKSELILPSAAEEAAPGFNPSARAVLRRTHTKPVILVANKYDRDSDDMMAQVAPFYELGFGDPVTISATHNNGMADLFTALTDGMGRVLTQWTKYQESVDKRARAREQGILTLEQTQRDINKRSWVNITVGNISNNNAAAADADDDLSKGVHTHHNTALPHIPGTAVAAAAAATAASDRGGKRRAVPIEFSLEPMPGVRVLRRKADDDGPLQVAEPQLPSHQQLQQQKPSAVAAPASGSKISRPERGENVDEEEDGDAPGGGVSGRLDVEDEDDDTVDHAWEHAQDALADLAAKSQAASPLTEEEIEEPMTVRVVIAGKPNVGKSTLINAVLGQNRLLTGPQAGITRDSVAIKWADERFPDHKFELVDTAGMKGVTEFAHSKFDRVDSIAMGSSLRALRKAHVLVLVIDIADGLYGGTGTSSGVDPVFAAQIRRNFVESLAAPSPTASNSGRTSGITLSQDQSGAPLGRRTQAYLDALHKHGPRGIAQVKQKPEKGAYLDKLAMMVNRVAGAVSRHDIDIARVAAAEGKSLIVVANKIDLLANGAAEVTAVTKGLQALFLQQLAQNRGVTVVPMSAKEQVSVDALPAKIVQVYNRWNTRVSTGLLNRWLRAILVLKPPPAIGGRRYNLKYITQTNIRPPTFSVFSGRKKEFPEDYRRFLVTALKEEFGLHGIPVRLHIRGSKNPYAAAGKGSRSEERKARQSKVHEKKAVTM